MDAHGFPVLLLPRGFRPELGRDEDALSADEARRVLGVRIIRSRTYWEGGNVINDTETCVIGADAVAENMARLGLTEREVRKPHRPRRRIVGRFGRQRRPVAVVSDPVSALGMLDSVLAHRALFARHLVPGRRLRRMLADEFAASARQRQPLLAQYRKMLEMLGYRVVGVPEVRLLGKAGAFGASRLDLSYCNVLPGLRRGRPSVHYLPWGIRALDRAAEARFRAVGVEPVRVSTDPVVADSLMQLSAGLHCFCGPLA